MEVIKKTILQALTTEIITGCTGNYCIIIPDLTVNYYFKICLTQETQDCGFFDINDQYPYQYPYSNDSYVGIGYQLLD